MARLLSLGGVGKRFGAVWALRGVDLDLDEGEIHALVGENGAGKSTLIKLLAGVHRPDEGVIRGAEGQLHLLASPRDALRAGIGVVHQELDLFDNLTVAENIALGPHDHGLFRTPRRRLRAQALAALGLLGGPAIDPDRKLGDLSTAQKQLVAIAKVLSWQARIIIFDEPTSALDTGEANALLAVIRGLKARGVGILYVSHKLSEIFAISDRVTVLRDGVRVGTFPSGELTHDLVVRHMLGRQPRDMFPPRRPGAGGAAPVCRMVEGHGPALHGASFAASAGEIVALAGLPDSGAAAALRTLFGLEPLHGGAIEIAGRRQPRLSPVRAIRAGLAYLAADRLRDGIMPLMDVLANVEAVARARALLGGGRLHRAALAEARKLNVRTASYALPITSLSGGNQQKALIARWLIAGPRILLLDDPTRGVDVGAKTEIYRVLRGIAATGTAILYTSSESLELAGLADRVVLFREGRVAEEIDGSAGIDHAALDRRIAAR